MHIACRRGLTALLIAAFAVLLLPAAAGAEDPAAVRARIMKDLDTDGDGVVSFEERDAARERHRLKRFDKNRDGKIDAEEQAVADRLRAERIGAWDKDKDGRLSKSEREAMRAEKRKDAIDADGDGTVSKAEREAFQKRRQEKRDSLVEKYDADGDGKLDAAERQKAEAAGEKVYQRDPERRKKALEEKAKRKQMKEQAASDG